MELSTLFLLAFIGAITPGPDMLLIMRNTLVFGCMQGIKVFSGIASGCIIYLCVIYFGFGYILSGEIAQIILSVFGALYLMYIALMLFKKSATHMTFKNAQNAPDTYIKALFVNLSNPKAILFFSVIITPFVQVNLLMSLFMLFCGLSSAFFVVILLATYFRHIICDKVFYIIDKICAALFICFSFLLFYHAYSIMLGL